VASDVPCLDATDRRRSSSLCGDVNSEMPGARPVGIYFARRRRTVTPCRRAEAGMIEVDIDGVTVPDGLVLQSTSDACATSTRRNQNTKSKSKNSYFSKKPN